MSKFQPLKARLHRHGHADRYSVIFDGKLLVDRCRDPECDAARALLALGYTGTLHMLDGKTGRPRAIIDIERTARLCVKEGLLRFAPYESRPDQAYSLESDAAGLPSTGGRRCAVAQFPAVANISSRSLATSPKATASSRGFVRLRAL